jgi:hypothetical protein
MIDIKGVGTLLGAMAGTAEGCTDEVIYGATLGSAVGVELGP